MLFTVNKKEDLSKWANKLDSYIDGWHDVIKKFETAHPEENRAELTKKILRELKALLGDRRQAIVTKEYHGNPEHDLDIDPNNFMSRVFADTGPINNRVKTKDKQSFIEYVITGELDTVVAMLRLYSMVEHELPVLMYVMTIRSWIKLHEDGIVNTVAWQDVEEAMEALSEKLSEISTERNMSNRLFQVSWLQARGFITVARNLQKAQGKLEGLDDTMGQHIVQEQSMQACAQQALQSLEDAKQDIYQNTQDILKDTDAADIVPKEDRERIEAKRAQEKKESYTAMSMFGSLLGGGQTLDSRSIRAVQDNNSQYNKVKYVLNNLSGQTAASLGKAQALLKIYSKDQQKVRKEYWAAAKQWQESYAKEMDSLINIQDPMNVVKYWDRDAKQERILAIKKANESLWGCLAKAVWVTSPSYVGKLDDADADKLQKKIEDPKNAFDNRREMINFQVVTQKNGKLSKKWFALGVGMVLFGIGLVVAGTMVGELSQFGASLIKSNLGIAVTSVIFYSAVCVGAFWRSRFLHTKNYDARKGVIEKLTGKSYEEKPWLIFGTSRTLTTNQEVKSRTISAEDIPVSRYSGSRGRYNTEDTERFIEELRQTAAECEQERRASLGGNTGGRYG